MQADPERRRCAGCNSPGLYLLDSSSRIYIINLPGEYIELNRFRGRYPSIAKGNRPRQLNIPQSTSAFLSSRRIRVLTLNHAFDSSLPPVYTYLSPYNPSNMRYSINTHPLMPEPFLSSHPLVLVFPFVVYVSLFSLLILEILHKLVFSSSLRLKSQHTYT